VAQAASLVLAAGGASPSHRAWVRAGRRANRVPRRTTVLGPRVSQFVAAGAAKQRSKWPRHPPAARRRDLTCPGERWSLPTAVVARPWDLSDTLRSCTPNSMVARTVCHPTAAGQRPDNLLTLGSGRPVLAQDTASAALPRRRGLLTFRRSRGAAGSDHSPRLRRHCQRRAGIAVAYSTRTKS